MKNKWVIVCVDECGNWYPEDISSFEEEEDTNLRVHYVDHGFQGLKLYEKYFMKKYDNTGNVVDKVEAQKNTKHSSDSEFKGNVSTPLISKNMQTASYFGTRIGHIRARSLLNKFVYFL